MKNNVFWLLFGSVALGISICALVLYFSILFAMEQDHVLDFADDIQELREDIEHHCAAHKLQQCIEEISQYSNFDTTITSTEPEIEDELVAEFDDQIVYEYQEQYFQSLTTIEIGDNKSSSRIWLLARDKVHSFDLLNNIENEAENKTEGQEEQEVEEDIDEYEIALKGAFYGIFILLVTLAICLYFPVKRLNAWLLEIQNASQQIGKQNYDIQLAEDKIQPLGELAKSINHMAARIKDHVREKNILANAIAHELRTPLTRFRLALGLLSRQKMDAMGQELLSDLERYTDDLEAITNSTLRLATLKDSAIVRQKIRLHDFIINQREKFQASFPQLTVEATTGIGEGLEKSGKRESNELETDIDFLQLALDNLISNACYYAEAKVIIKQGYHNGRLYIEVADDGPGIPAEDIEYVQQAFTRLDKSRNRETGGTGLGLAIVRIAVQRLEGELIFQPAHQGTCVRLVFPLNHN